MSWHFLASIEENNISQAKKTISQVAIDDVYWFSNVFNSTSVDYEPFTCLYYAVQFNRPEICEIILQRGAKFIMEPEIGEVSALGLAIRNGSIDILKVMMKYANRISLEMWVHAFDIAIDNAVNEDVMVLLVEHVDNLHALQTEVNVPVIEHAVGGNMVRVLQTIVENHEKLVLARFNGRTLWQLAVAIKDKEMFEYLMQLEIVKEAIDLQKDATIVYYVLAEIVELDYLLKLQEDYGFSVFAKTDDGNTVLHFVHDSKHAENLYQQVKHVFSVNELNKAGESPLMLAAQRNQADVIHFFVHHKASINLEQPSSKRTALAYAIENNNISAAKALLEYNGCKVNFLFIPQNIHNQNYPETLTYPIMYATYFNFSEILQLLIDRGANLNVRNNQGSTALAYANTSIRRLLHNNGCPWDISASEMQHMLKSMLQDEKECDLLLAWMEYGMIGNPIKCITNKSSVAMISILQSNVHRVQLVDAHTKQQVAIVMVSTWEKLIDSIHRRHYSTVEVVISNVRYSIISQAQWKAAATAISTNTIVSCIIIVDTPFTKHEKRFTADVKFC